MIGGEDFVTLAPTAVWIIAAVLFVYAVLGMPLFALIGATASLFYITADPQLDLTTIFLSMAVIVDQPFFVTIPLFVLAGVLLAESQAPTRIVAFCRAWIGWLPAGLAIEAIVACALFTAFTGASGVTIVALGGLLYPMLRREDYPKGFSLGLLTTGGSLGLLFPPSLPVLVYALYSGANIDRLFLAGLIPGVLLLVLLSGYSLAVGIRKQVPRHRFSVRAALRATASVLFELPIPIIVIGGIYSGLLDPINASAVAAAYVLLIEVVIYRDIRLRDVPRVMRKTAELVGAILVILGMALGLKNYLVDAEVPQAILGAMKEQITSPLTFLLMLNLFLLVVGCLLDIFSAIIVVVPMIVPIAKEFGINEFHLGVIFLTNLEIGYLTPPVGMNLFLASLRFRRPILEIAKHSLPFLAILLLALAIITYVPWLSTVLVDWLKPVPPPVVPPELL